MSKRGHWWDVNLQLGTIGLGHWWDVNLQLGTIGLGHWWDVNLQLGTIGLDNPPYPNLWIQLLPPTSAGSPSVEPLRRTGGLPGRAVHRSVSGSDKDPLICRDGLQDSIGMNGRVTGKLMASSLFARLDGLQWLS